MSKAKELEVLVVKRKGESLPQKLYRTDKKFREGWDEFTEAVESGKQIGYREGYAAGLAEGMRKERRALRRSASKLSKNGASQQSTQSKINHPAPSEGSHDLERILRLRLYLECSVEV